MKYQFGIWDYVVLFAMLAISSAIGIYYKFSGGKQKTVKEFLLADKNMSIVPVAFSLAVSFMSAVTIMGESSESYTYGIQYVAINFGYILFTPVAVYLYLPVFFRLQTTSVYEYLELRFGKTARLLASMTYTLQMVMYTGVVLYAPALTMEALMNINQVSAICVVGLVCTFYSTIGGMKAVLISDLFQAILMFAAIFSIIFSALFQHGSFKNIWSIADAGGRTNFFNVDLDPTVRHTWMSLTLGGGIMYLSLFAVNQTQVQRYLTVKDLKGAQRALWLNLPLLVFLSLGSSFAGLAIFSKYYSCDPLATGKINSSDQLMPYYVVDSLGHLPGLSGLFVAGIFSASLSTISSTLNSVSAVTLEDYLKPLYLKITKSSLNESSSIFWTRFLSFFYGFVCIAIAFLAKYLEGILQACLTIFGAVGGPILGLFSLGIFTEVANESGSLCGLTVGLFMSLLISFGGPKPPTEKLYSRTDCNSSVVFFEHNKLTGSLYKTSLENDFKYFWLYRLSYLYNGVIGFLCAVIIGYASSFILGKLQENQKQEKRFLKVSVLA